MTLDDLVRNPGAWLAAGDLPAVIVSSRVRLARNLAGVAFPGWAGEDESARIQEGLRDVLKRLPSLLPGLTIDMASAGAIDRDFLRERHLISNELAQKSRGSGLILRADETLSVMVNEEDHLRLQAMRPGLDLANLWTAMDALDNEIEAQVRYAYTSDLGYLTACPSNVGTGLRASVMVHLPGLRLTNEIEPIVRGLTKIGLAVRGLQGEGTEASGNMFQISNQTTLGESESAIIERLAQIVNEVAAHEQNARLRLMEQREAQVRDCVGRAYGVLSQARVLTSQEALDYLSGLRLGIELGMIQGLGMGDVNRLVVYTQPGHLQKVAGRTIDPGERDEVRAGMVREQVRRAAVVED